VRLDLPEPIGQAGAVGGDDLDSPGLSETEERLVYRVVQECLRNAATHAAPCTATVLLRREEAVMVLDVLDDGPGFDPSALGEPRPGHLGVRVLSDLATEAGATLHVASAPGRGTHWRLAIPGRRRPARGAHFSGVSV
jgi:signal transduction histidine kinase